MRTLVTGASGYVGAALVPALTDAGHDVLALSRDPSRVRLPVPVAAGDVRTGEGLDAALDGVDVAYYLVHSMEAASDGTTLGERERDGAEAFAAAARRAGVRRIVYLGVLVPSGIRPQEHVRSRLAVEEALLDATPEAVALRASIAIGTGSRSFRFLVRLVERVPVLPLPPWRHNRTAPVDGRDLVEALAAAGSRRDLPAARLSLDVAGPDVLTYGAMIERIRDLLVLSRPTLGIPVALTGIASRVAAVLAGEEPELVGPLMGGLGTDLLPRDDRATGILGLRPRGFDRAVEHALAGWEAVEPLVAR